MSDKPIIFSGPMVRALLEGRKTQTRRVAKITAVMGDKVGITSQDESLIELEDGEFRRGIFHYLSTGGLSGPYRLPYAVGDRLWVRETWSHTGTGVWTMQDALRALDGKPIYAADAKYPGVGWFPSIHMHRLFSRILLTVTDLRVQRLQDISNEDAKAEGCAGWYSPRHPDHGVTDGQMPFEEFRDLWNSINAKRGFGWDDNPWVAAYTFTVEKGE